MWTRFHVPRFPSLHVGETDQSLVSIQTDMVTVETDAGDKQNLYFLDKEDTHKGGCNEYNVIGVFNAHKLPKRRNKKEGLA